MATSPTIIREATEEVNSSAPRRARAGGTTNGEAPKARTPRKMTSEKKATNAKKMTSEKKATNAKKMTTGKKTTAKKAAATKTAAKKTAAKKMTPAKKATGANTATRRRGPKVVTEEHRQAMVRGRLEARAIDQYLHEVSRNGRPGRRRSPERATARLVEITESLPTATGIARLELVQERNTLQQFLSESDSGTDTAALEAAFVEHAGRYSARKGVSYDTWRELGVSPAVLRQAGIAR